jgi:hypothetical protein
MRRFTRDEKWDGWPMDNIEEFAELSDLAVRLVVDAESFGSYNAAVNYDSHEFSTRYPDELRSEAPDLPLEGAEKAFFRMAAPGDELEVLVLVGESSFGDARTTLEVHGQNQTHVVGIYGQLREEIDQKVAGVARIQRPRLKEIEKVSNSKPDHRPFSRIEKLTAWQVALGAAGVILAAATIVVAIVTAN